MIASVETLSHSALAARPRSVSAASRSSRTPLPRSRRMSRSAARPAAERRSPRRPGGPTTTSSSRANGSAASSGSCTRPSMSPRSASPEATSRSTARESSTRTSARTSGAASARRASIPGRWHVPHVMLDARRIVAAAPSPIERSSSPRSASTPRACASSRRPASVGTMRRARRSKSRTPKRSSRSRTAWLTDGCDTLSSRAAALTPPASHTAAKISRCLIVMRSAIAPPVRPSIVILDRSYSNNSILHIA